jgi:hypothetical protein
MMQVAGHKEVDLYPQTNLVTSMKSLKAKVHDKNLINIWGLVQGDPILRFQQQRRTIDDRGLCAAHVRNCDCNFGC